MPAIFFFSFSCVSLMCFKTSSRSFLVFPFIFPLMMICSRAFATARIGRRVHHGRCLACLAYFSLVRLLWLYHRVCFWCGGASTTLCRFSLAGDIAFRCAGTSVLADRAPLYWGVTTYLFCPF